MDNAHAKFRLTISKIDRGISISTPRCNERCPLSSVLQCVPLPRGTSVALRIIHAQSHCYRSTRRCRFPLISFHTVRSRVNSPSLVSARAYSHVPHPADPLSVLGAIFFFVDVCHSLGSSFEKRYSVPSSRHCQLSLSSRKQAHVLLQVIPVLFTCSDAFFLLFLKRTCAGGAHLEHSCSDSNHATSGDHKLEYIPP